MRTRKISVNHIVAATLVTVTTLLLGTFGAIDSLARRASEWSRLRRVTAAQAEEIAVALALPVWNIDRAQIEKILDSQSGAGPVEGIIVHASGKTHARTRDAQRRFVASDGRFSTEGLLSAERPITFNGERIGSVQLFTTPRFIEQQLRDSLTATVISVIAVDLMLIVSVYWILWRAVLRPLFGIERYAVAVRMLGSAPSVQPATTAELESLRVSIETMVGLLDHRYGELQAEAARRVEMEKALRRSETMSAMGAIVAGVAHEVRNPLFGMSALLDAYDGEMRDAALTELSAGLREQVTRLTHLTRELLDFGRPGRVTREPGNLHSLLDDVLRARAPMAETANVTLRSTVDPSLPDLAMDRERLCQVFENVLDNAIQHAPPVRTITIAAARRDIDGQPWIECTIEDDGDGFQPDDLPVVFEPFFTRRERGVGLGMSIVQRIVEEHGGRVSAGNRAGGGAIVTVTLPT